MADLGVSISAVREDVPVNVVALGFLVFLEKVLRIEGFFSLKRQLSRDGRIAAISSRAFQIGYLVATFAFLWHADRRWAGSIDVSSVVRRCCCCVV